MQTVVQDVRYAVRLLLRSPGFACTSLIVLALAIGANVAIFSAVKGVLIAPLPYPDPDRLVRLFEENPTTPHFPLAPADFRDYRAELRTFEGIAAFLRNDLQLADGERPEQFRGMQVTAGFFKVLGWRPTVGREFEPNDEITGNNDVVMVSHGLWMRKFGGRADVVGDTVRLSGRVYRIVGVVPANFQHVGGTYNSYAHGEPVDVWTVMTVPRDENPRHRFSHYFNVVGRIRPGVSWSSMEEDLRSTGALVAKRYPVPNSQWVSRAVPLKDEIVGRAESTLVALAGAAGAVLLLACVNVAGLLLGRAAGRAREMGVRAALGATRARLARQLLIESGVLAAIGGTLGVILAYAAVVALARYGPADTPRLQAIAVDTEVLLYSVTATALSALLFGLAPALHLARGDVGGTVKQGGRSIAGPAKQRLRQLLAVAEVALAFVLVVSGGLLLRSFVALLNTPPGFRAQGVITASLELPVARYETNAQAADFFGRALDGLRAVPGVREVGFGSDLPWTGYDENTSFTIVGRAVTDGDEPEARYHFVTPGYMASTGIPIVAGRDVTTADRLDAPPVIFLNEAAARKYWTMPQAAIGARVNLWGKVRTVAGVIGDVRDVPWDAQAVPALYFPQAQNWYPQRMFLIARVDVEPSSAIDPIRRAIANLDPQLPLANVRPLDAVAAAAMATRRLTLWLVGTFAITALVLAVVGIYGLMAQAVAQRAQEFGIRQALGATRLDILRTVLSGAAILTVAGVTAGLVLSLASTRLLASLLYGVTAADPVTFVSVSASLLTTALLASYLPARRATRVSPASALRASE